MSPKTAWFERTLPVAALLLLTAALGCSAKDPAPASPMRSALDGPPPVAAEPFSVERAWAHLVALSELGPRPAGSQANREALEYIRSRLEELDLETIDIEYTGDPEEEGGAARTLIHHLSARIPGDSPDSIMLLAHYDTFLESPGANHGASGPAVMLELARQLVERPLPYTVELVFLDGDMGYLDDQPGEPLLEGGRMLADYLGEAGTLDVVRLAVFFGQVGDADLTIGQDLHSQRLDRETFFATAAALGLGAAFPRDRGFVQSRVSHRAFVAAGMPRVVLLHDPWYGGDEMPGEYYGGEQDVRDHCAPQSLHTVGVVTLAALRQISARLMKVDHVSGRAARRAAETRESPQLVEEPVAEPAEAATDGSAEAPEAEMQPEGDAAADPAEAPSEPASDVPTGAEDTSESS